MKNKPFWLLCLLCVGGGLYAQNKVELQTFDAKALPASVEYKGTLLDGKRWKDANGDNFFILTRTADKVETIDGVQKKTAFIYGFHYTGTEGHYQLLRKLAEPLKECSAALSDIYLVPHSLWVGDQDGDGKAEIAFLHATICSTDKNEAVPVQLTLIEDGGRYTMLGTMAVLLAADDRATGSKAGTVVVETTYNVGAEFKNADPSLLEFAERHWKDYAVIKR